MKGDYKGSFRARARGRLRCLRTMSSFSRRVGYGVRYARANLLEGRSQRSARNEGEVEPVSGTKMSRSTCTLKSTFVESCAVLLTTMRRRGSR